jgi:O-antigen/teichoic acid export membrane protein/4-amino-4-deoxy-L-arabinose transferase-like glycosyltransferase
MVHLVGAFVASGVPQCCRGPAGAPGERPVGSRAATPVVLRDAWHVPDLRTRRTAAVGGVLLALRFVVSAVLNYGFGIALVWVLPKAEFGIVGVLQNVLLLAAMVLGGSFTWVVSRVTARAGTIDGDAAAVFRAGLAGNLAVGAVFVVVLVAVHALPSSGARGLLAAVVLTVALMAVNGILYAALQGMQRFDAIALQQTVEVVVKVGLGLGLVVGLGFGVTGVALGFLAGTLVAGLLCLRGLRDLLPGRGPVALRRTAALALPTGVGAAGLGLLLTLDVIALGAVGPTSGVTTATIATYQAAAILARTPYYLAEAVGNAAYPDIARDSGSAAAHGWFVAAFRWIPLVLVPLQLVLLVAPEPILRLFFPRDYANAAGLVRLLTLGTLGLMVTSLLFTALYATGFELAVARRLPVAAALELGVLVALVPRTGALGAGIAFAVGSWSAAALLARAYLGHHRVRPLGRGLLARYLAAVAVLAGGLVVARALPAPVDLLLLPLPLVGYAAAAVRLGLLRESDLVRARAVRDALRRRAGPLAGRVRGVVAASGRDLLTAACAAFVATTLLWNLSTSPDTQYDEVVYTTAAWRVAQTGDLTWTGQPLFVHPPLSFLAQSAWLSIVGRGAADLPAVIGMTRLLAGLVAIANIGLLALLTTRLTPAAGGRRRSVLVLAVVALAATDPILLRYSRLAIIEPFAIFTCLVALNLSWVLRDRRARIAVPALGLATGLALLTNEIGIFLLVTPLVHALLCRAWPLIRRAAAVLVVGAVVWLVFPLWALQLGLFPSFVEVKASTLRRLVGAEQDSGWNQPGASFVTAVVEHAGQYLTSYLLLAGGAAALLWLACHRLTDTARWLLAWLLTSYGFAAYTVMLGTLNEQFFTYVLPAAVAGTVLVAEAAVTVAARPGRTRAALPAVVLVLVVGLALTSWARTYGPRNDGLVQATTALRAGTPACTAVNASGDPEKYTYLLPGYTITDFATGPAALSHGVQLFFVSDKDAELHYGNSSPALAAWVRAKGERLAAYPSATYRGVEVWYVPLEAANPLSGVEQIPDGEFVLRDGSRCAGFPVVDGPGGSFASGWAEFGGKARFGSPLTASWTADGGGRQVFDGGVLATTAGPDVVAAPVVLALAQRAPEAYRQANLPPVAPAAATAAGQDALLTDPDLTAFYLGSGSAADPDVRAEAQRRLGRPLGPPATMPDGQVRQAFESVVLQHPVGGHEVTFAPVGSLAVAAGVVAPPPQARAPEPPPPLPVDQGPVEPSTIGPFVPSLAVAVGLLLLALGAGAATAPAAALLRRRTS